MKVRVGRNECERTLIWPDTHYPYEDKESVELVLQVAKHFRPHRVVILGDWIDCFTVSDHDKDPRRITQLEEELESANAGLDAVDDLPDVQHVTFCKGNHEYRLWRYLVRNAPALLNTVSIDKLLRFKERGYSVVEYMKHTRVGKMYATHDVGHAGVHAVRATGAATGSNIVFGHTHRLGVAYTGTIEGKRYVSASLGWLGDAMQAEYLPEAKKREWQTGFGVARFERNGNVHLQAVPIVSGRCLVDGRLHERKRFIAA